MGQSPLGFVARAFSGALSPGQVDQQRALWETQRHGKHYAAVYGTPTVASPATVAKAGSVFRASNQSAAALTAALATTYTGICLSNPAGSTVNLAVKRVNGMFGPAAATAVNLGLITGWAAGGITVHTTPITQIVNAYVGAAASSGSILANAPVGLVDAACTLVGTPAWDRWLTPLASAGTGGFIYDVDDDLIIPPGGYVAVGNLVANASGFLGTFMWEEIAP